MLPEIYPILRASAAVSSIVATRIFRHGNAPQSSDRPYVTWFLAGGGPENTLSETPQADRCSVQVDCWHTTDAGVQDLAEAVRDALEAEAHVTGFLLNERDFESRMYRIALQCDFVLDRTPASSV